MAADWEAQIEALLEQARLDSQLPPSDKTRTARLILNHGRFLATLPPLLAYHRGERDTASRLIETVAKLLQLCFGDPASITGWATEVPRGRAPEVRKVLLELKKMRDAALPPTNEGRVN